MGRVSGEVHCQAVQEDSFAKAYSNVVVDR